MLKKIRFFSVFLCVVLAITAFYIKSDNLRANAFESQLAAFPPSYHEGLRRLHAQHPTWKFYADNLSVSFSDAVNEQYSTPFRKAVNMSSDGISWRSMQDGVYNWGDGSWNTFDGGKWTSASREVIAYYMDPRNFLDTTTVYMFMQQSYDSDKQTVEVLRKIIEGSFLEKGYSGGDYVDDIMVAAKQSGVNPYIIATTIIIEQGVKGESSLISGTYSGYEGYYNFFNFKATGNDVVANGLSYAKTEGWNSRRASIIGGAKRYGENYIVIGQDTYYYKDFNVKLGNYSHQYAQNVYDARASAAYFSRKCSQNSISLKNISFHIPVYSSIPDTLAPRPEENDKLNNYYLTSLSASGLEPAFSMYHYNYNLNVAGDTTVGASLPSGASIVSNTTVSLSAGGNTVPITVKAQTGYTNTYNITVNASAPCTLTVTTDMSAITVKNGDSNGDGKIDVIDLANTQKYIVGRIALDELALRALDTNGDGKIDVIDLANIQKHIVGRINLSQ